MEIEPTPPLAKKPWNIVRLCTYMLKKGLSKNNLTIDLNILFKKGKQVGKALRHIVSHHHHASMSCSSTDVQLSYISSKEYEFSCSNTPMYPSFISRKKNPHYHHIHRSHDVKLVKNIYDMLKKYETPVEASPLGLGFGVSPKVRQLRVTDSPFALKGEENEDIQVDKMAEEFISKFYKDLKNQKIVAALQSPLPNYLWVS